MVGICSKAKKDFGPCWRMIGIALSTLNGKRTPPPSSAEPVLNKFILSLGRTASKCLRDVPQRLVSTFYGVFLRECAALPEEDPIEGRNVGDSAPMSIPA